MYAVLSLGRQDPCLRPGPESSIRLPIPFPAGYGDPTRFVTLSAWIGPSVVDITEAPDASVILSMGLIASANVSIGSPPVICLGFEDMWMYVSLKDLAQTLSFLNSMRW